MISIKNTIFSVLIGVIGIFTFAFVFFIFFHLNIVAQYKNMTDRIIVEQDIPDYSSTLILDYYHYAVDINNASKRDLYLQSIKKLDDEFFYLDGQITERKSNIQYVGLKNIVKNIEKELDRGIKLSQQGDISKNSTIYDTANHDNSFVTEVTRNLVFEELHAVERVNADLQKTNFTILTLGLITFVLIVIGSIIFSLIFSSRISKPLIELSSLSEKIAHGELEHTISPQILTKKDEIGILGHAFQVMLDNLKSKMHLLEESEKNIRVKNDDLERFNKLVIGRELTMIALKDEIKQLQEQVAKNTVPPEK